MTNPFASGFLEDDQIDQAVNLINRNRYPDAIQMLLPLTNQGQPNVRALIVLAAAFIDYGQPAKAESIAQRLVLMLPDNAIGHQLLASAYKAMGRKTDAIRAGELAVQLGPNDANNHQALAEAKAGFWTFRQSAREAAQETIRLAPNSVNSHITASLVSLSQHRYREGERHARTALSIEPNNAAAHNNLGAALLGQRRFGSANHHFGQSAQHDPTDNVAVGNIVRSVGVFFFTLYWAVHISAMLLGRNAGLIVLVAGLIFGIYQARTMPNALLLRGLKHYALLLAIWPGLIVASMFALFGLTVLIDPTESGKTSLAIEVLVAAAFCAWAIRVHVRRYREKRRR